jgi:hypothetical protein
MTLLKPKPGLNADAQRALEELDDCFAGAGGLLMSFVTQIEANRLGRIALWQSKDEANHEATRERVLALRSRLRSLSLETQDVLMDVKSGYLPGALASQLVGYAANLPAQAVAAG